MNKFSELLTEGFFWVFINVSFVNSLFKFRCSREERSTHQILFLYPFLNQAFHLCHVLLNRWASEVRRSGTGTRNLDVYLLPSVIQSFCCSQRSIHIHQNFHKCHGAGGQGLSESGDTYHMTDLLMSSEAASRFCKVLDGEKKTHVDGEIENIQKFWHGDYRRELDHRGNWHLGCINVVIFYIYIIFLTKINNFNKLQNTIEKIFLNHTSKTM